MALIWIRADDGRPVLVHTSIFDRAPRPARALGVWEEVWKRVEAQKSPQSRELFSPSPR